MSAFSLCSLCLLAFIVLVEKLAFCLIVFPVQVMCFFLCPVLRFSVFVPVPVCAYVPVLVFCIYPVWDSWNFLNCVESLIRLGKFSDIIHSNAAIALFFFTPSSLLHICDTFDSVLRIFYALYSCFLSFLYFFLPKPQFQIHISESLDIFYWVCLSFSNWVFSSCCFTLKTSSKFLIAEIMFFNYNVHFITTFL